MVLDTYTHSQKPKCPHTHTHTHARTHAHAHTQMAMTSVILNDRAVRAEQCSVLSGFFSGLNLAACSDITQQGPSKSMTLYYRRSNHCVPSQSLSKHTVSCHLWRKSTTALWTSCSPLSPSRYGTLNPGKFIYEAHLTASFKNTLTERRGSFSFGSIKNPVIIISMYTLFTAPPELQVDVFKSRTKWVKTA